MKMLQEKRKFMNDTKEIIDKNGNIMNKKRKIEMNSVKNKFKKEQEPLPMKLRALPRSFWQQPNTSRQSPSNICPDLPILDKEDVAQNTGSKPTTIPSETTTPANTELLFSLFRVIDNRKSLIRRGRPRKTVPNLIKQGLKDSDPCLVSTVDEPPMVVVKKGRKDINENNSYSNLLAELVVRL